MRRTDGLLKLLGLCLLAGVLLAGMLFPVVGGMGVLSNQASATVENTSTELAEVPPPLVTTITDSNGKAIAKLYRQYRIPTATDQISEAMKWALISIEDRRFHDHNGVDWKGTIRAAISNTQGGDVQGASTLTQQYVKNYLINVVYWNDRDPAHRLGRQKAQEQSLARKLKEARIAIQLETKMNKEEILTGYLNVVEFSRRIFGVGAAARAYFKTTAKKLTVAQSALLAGMVNNPAALDPWSHPERAKKRRNLVIDKMVTYGALNPEAGEKAKKQPLGVVPGGPTKPPANCVGAGTAHGFFCKYVENYLIKRGFTEDDLYTGGYTIKTTLDRKANDAAKKSAEEQIPTSDKDAVVTLSIVKPGTKRREVVALAANRNYGPDAGKHQTEYPLPSGVYNTQGAGSTYKIFTTAAAMKKGVVGLYDRVQSPSYHVSSVFTGGADRCPFAADGSHRYCLENATEGYPASMTLQQALATSPNTAFVILEEKAGMKNVLQMAYDLGMRETMATNAAGKPPDPKNNDNLYAMTQQEYYGPRGNWPGMGFFTLGQSPLSGLELANVDATIMSEGVWCPPTPIKEVLDRNGNPVEVKEEPCEQAISKDLANSLAVGMSKDHVGSGTAARAAGAIGWTRPMIGKTGTSQDNASAAFVGATPQYAGAAMVFQPDAYPKSLCDGGPGLVYKSCGDPNMWGGGTPARTWFGAMKVIHEGLPVQQLPKAAKQYERAKK